MSKRTLLMSLSLVGMMTLACSTEPAAPPTSKSTKGANVDKTGSGGSDTSKLNDKDPLAAFLDNGEEKTPGELRDAQVWNLMEKADRINGLANDYRSKCFSMSTKMISREDSKLIRQVSTKTGAGAAVSSAGQIGVGVLGASLSGDWGSTIGGLGSGVGKSIGDGISAESNWNDIKSTVAYINSLEAADMATCEATVKNLKAKANGMYRQINDLRNMGTE